MVAEAKASALQSPTHGRQSMKQADQLDTDIELVAANLDQADQDVSTTEGNRKPQRKETPYGHLCVHKPSYCSMPLKSLIWYTQFQKGSRGGS